MIPSVTMAATGGSSSSGVSSNTSNGVGAIGKDEFLKLLVTQLKNQDPMSPMQPNEFAAQLAQFTSVEQLIQLNSSMNSQSSAVELSTLAGQASLGASLIGRRVIAEGNQLIVPSSGAASVRIEIGGQGGNATLKLTDANGREVATRNLGALPGGRQTIALPSDLPAGTYSYSVDVRTSNQTKVHVTTFTTGVVDAVHFDTNAIVLRLGSLRVSLGDVAEIESASDLNTATRP